MLDIQFIREHPEVVKESQRKRGESVELVDEVLRSDEVRRTSLKKYEEARAKKFKAEAEAVRRMAAQKSAETHKSVVERSK